MMHQRPLTSQGSVPSVGGQGEVPPSPSLGQALGKESKMYSVPVSIDMLKWKLWLFGN